ncbi:MAG: hypothetical protein IJ418_19000 [Clostridia bacterium]|nr:hypothetical protein [Clostridia bacterium]
MNKVRIKFGPIEFEAEGDSELIERERSQFFSLLPQAIAAVSPVVPPSQQLLEADVVDPVSTEHPEPVPVLVASPDTPQYESLAGFMREKRFSTGVEIVMGVAYYIDQIEGTSPFTSKEIETALDDARQTKPSNISQMIVQNIKKGYLRELKEKKDGYKAFCVLEKGKNWCEEYTPRAADNKKSNSRAKTPKQNVESPLVSFSLDELNLDKYCDISQLAKFNEQMLVLMLIYTREKGIEYFSFNDIVSVLKTKFKLPATDRKVRYAFDSGGTMFDKKVEKKIAYHKLMAAGIREAEKIVAEAKADSV